MQNNYGNQVTYGGFCVRLAAYIIDVVIVWSFSWVLRFPLMGLRAVSPPDSFISGGILFHHTLIDIVVYLAGAAYFTLLTYYTGATLGKRLMNLKVVADKGEPLTLFQVLFRETIGRFLSGVILSIGYIMIGIDKEKRGIHDIICDTRVIYEKKVRQVPAYRQMPTPAGPGPMPQMPAPGGSGPMHQTQIPGGPNAMYQTQTPGGSGPMYQTQAPGASNAMPQMNTTVETYSEKEQEKAHDEEVRF